MREPKPRWVAALKATCGADHDLRWNEQAGRWEFIIPGADGVPRSQFWGWFYDPRTGQRVEPDPVSGMVPFRDLDDAAMAEALDNLQRTYIGNRHDGAGTTRREFMRRHRHNQAVQRAQYLRAGELFADMVADRGLRLRGGVQIHVPVTIGGKA